MSSFQKDKYGRCGEHFVFDQHGRCYKAIKKNFLINIRDCFASVRKYRFFAFWGGLTNTINKNSLPLILHFSPTKIAPISKKIFSLFIVLLLIFAFLPNQASSDKKHKKKTFRKTQQSDKANEKKLPVLFTRLDKNAKHNLNFAEIKKKTKDELKYILKKLPLEIKIAQIFICWPSIKLNDNLDFNVGGLIFSHSHIPSMEKISSAIEEFNKNAFIPLFYAIDQEGGKVNRLKRIEALENIPSAMEMGIWSPKKTKEFSEYLSKLLKNMNFNMNLAPILDVSIEGFMFETQRSFSADTSIVIQTGKAFAEGMRKNEILCIAKHFPGYGNTIENSDLEIASLEIPADSIKGYIDIFRALKDKVHGIMMSHIIYRMVDKLPASISTKIINIAKSINPNWLIISDFVESKALLEYNENDRIKTIANSFLAGNDMLITTRTPQKLEKYLPDILEVGKKNKKFISRLDESVEKILIVKEMLYPGLLSELYLFLQTPGK